MAAYRELPRRDSAAVAAVRAGLGHHEPAVRAGCCRLLDRLADGESMGQLIAMADDADARARAALDRSQLQDPSPAVRKQAGWFLPGGTGCERTAPRPPR
ncbi:hypothetical protein [Streptomyces sp. NPDC001450]